MQENSIKQERTNLYPVFFNKNDPLDIKYPSDIFQAMDIKKLSPARIKKIRNAAGLTQQEFADELQVAKVTVARWESGTRNCLGDYAKKVKKFASQQAKHLIPTSTVFEVGARQLQALGSAEAVRAFRDLLWSELRRVKVPSSDVSLGTKEIADHGIDAHVQSTERLESSDTFLEGGDNHFQIKAGASWKPWTPSFAKRELLGSSKQLGSAVESCLTHGGKYILVCFGNDLTPVQRKSAIENIEKIFADKGFANAKVDVWGQQELLGHIQRFPFLSLRLSERDRFQFLSWSGWQCSNEMSNKLELGEEQDRLCKEIRQMVRDENVCHVRIVGEPGLGKSRLVLESLARDGLSQLVVYVPHAEDFQNSRLYHDILHPDADYCLILVLDECRPRECKEIWDRLSNHSDRCMVVSLDHDSYHPSDERFVQIECPRLEDEKIEKIIDSYTGQEGSGRRWSELCSGVPRVAHAIGQNLKTNPDDLLKSPSMNLIWERFISGYRSIESSEAKEKLIVLRYIALFHRFGFETPVESEGKFISDLIEADHGISYARFQSIVAELKRQRILQGKVTLFIAPKLLHVHLWTQFWELHGRGISIGGLFQQIPDEIRSWFVRMFPYAGESRVASAQVEKFLGPEGPFNDTGFAFSSVGCRFLHELSSASPKHVLLALERVFGNADDSDLKGIAGRQDIVWALERIAVWPQFFCRAARLLRQLAVFENSNSSNNSTGTFISLFCPAPGVVAPTAAAPAKRLPILRETLADQSDDVKRLGIKACKAALNTYPGIRVIGREHHGLRTVEMWTPETWGEVFQAMKNAWQVFFECTREWRLELRSEANDGLIEAGFRLLANTSLSEVVLESLEKLVDDEATNRQALVKQIAWVRRRSKGDAGDLSEEVLKRLWVVDERLAGSNFSDRVNRIVHWSGFEDQYDPEKKNHDSFNDKVKELASEASRSIESFERVLPSLVIGTNNVLFHFGSDLADCDNGQFLSSILQEYRQSTGSISDLFLGGYLRKLFDLDREKWNSTLDEILSDKVLRPMVCLILRNSGATDKIVLRVLEKFDVGLLDINCLIDFGYSRYLATLSEPVFLAFVKRLIESEQVAYAVALFSVVYCDKQNSRKLPEHDTMTTLSAFAKNDTREYDYQWGEVAKAFVEQFPKRKIELFETVLSGVESRESHSYPSDYSLQVIYPIIKSAPKKCWQVISARIDAAEGLKRYFLIHWLAPGMSFGDAVGTGPLLLFPMDTVFDWVDQDPETRAYELVRAVPKSLARDEVGNWARELLNRYGNQEDVRRGLLSHFWSGGWSGNLSDRYRQLRETARGWLAEETSLRIREWLEEFIDWLSRDIERAEIEEEREY